MGSILTHLSQRVLEVIPDIRYTGRLGRLLDTLLTWENRPVCLTPIAYQWCSAISESIGRSEQDGSNPGKPPRSHYDVVGPRPSPRDGPNPCADPYRGLLFMALAVGFRQIGPNHISSDIHLTHTRHHESMLDNVFTSEDDDVVADVVSVWIVDPLVTPSGSCTRRLRKLTERTQPFSPRLRRTIVHAIQSHWLVELEADGLEFVLLLNHLEVDVGDVDDVDGAAGKLCWVSLLAGVLRSPAGREHLSSHYWLLLGNLVSMGARLPPSSPGPDIEIMRSLEDTEDWGKLETWLLTIWGSSYTGEAVPMQDVERATFRLFRQRAAAIQRFEDLCGKRTPNIYAHLFRLCGDQFRHICDHARAEQRCPDSPS